MESKHTKKDIFLGFKAYTESDADIFKGRSADIERLYDLVSNKDYVLCYAESGEGKSSLIDAGLTPRLRANRYFPVKISFTDEEYNDNNINFDEVVKSRIMEAVSEQQNLSFVPKSESVFNKKYSDDLWWFLRNNTLSLYGISFTIVLIFDQFEEVINYPKSEVWTSRFFAFLEKISTDNCPQYILDDINATVDSNDLEFPDIFLKKNFKAIFSIRTEYIGELDYWCMQRYFIPDLKHNRFCLKSLTLQGADEVMQQYEGFDAELRDNIKDVLLRLKNKDNRTVDVSNNSEQYIPALILSVVCTSLYQNNDKVLTNSLIADSIENFYNDKIRECNITPEERNTIASVLVDKDKRVRVASDCSALEKIKFNSKYKDALLRNRLIKKSNVNGVEYIELVHDSLIDVVKKHKEEAMLKELRKKRRRNISIFSFMSAVILLFVILIVGLKKNEKNYLITQAKFIVAEAEKLAENGNVYDAVRLWIHVCKNNKEIYKISDFIHVARYVDANYTIPKKEFKHKNVVNSVTFSPDGRCVVTSSYDKTSKLWSVESGKCLMTMEHNKDVNSASFSPDGRYVVTSSYDKTSKLWSVESGECLMTMNHDGCVNSASFSPDGRYVVTASDDKTSKLLSVERGECIMTMNHEDGVISASFSPDGRYVVTASDDKTSKLWSVESGECHKTMNHDGEVNSASFSPDGRYVVTASDDKTSKLWSVESGECLMTMNHYGGVKSALFSFILTLPNGGVPNGGVKSASFSPDGRYVVTASDDMTSKLWSVESGECIMTMEHNGNVNSALFSPYGRYVVTASVDNTSKLWSVESGECLMTMNHEDGVNSASFSPDGRYVVTASWDKTSKLWSVESGDCLMTMNYEDVVNSASFSPDGRYVVTASWDKTSKLWSVESGECILTMNHEDRVSSASFSPDGRYVVTASWNKTSKLWSVESGECILTMNHEDRVSSASFSPDGRYIVTASCDNTSKLWSVESGECHKTMEHNGDVNSASFSPDGRYVVTASCDNTSKLWSVESGECLMTMNHGSIVNSASFSPDGRYVVTASDDMTSKLWSVESGECIMTMEHNRDVKSATFSPDGRYVVTSSYDKTSKLWSVESGECLMTMNHENVVKSATFSPDGRYVVTSSYDKTSKLWSVESGECLMTMNHENVVKSASFSPDGRCVVTASGREARIHTIKSPEEILDKWSEFLGSNAELTKEEKEKYFLN